MDIAGIGADRIVHGYEEYTSSDKMTGSRNDIGRLTHQGMYPRLEFHVAGALPRVGRVCGRVMSSRVA